MELGVFSLSDIYPDSTDTAQSRIDDIISYGILAEQHGLDVYGVGEHQLGTLGIFGPSRMEYQKVIPLVHYLGETLSRALAESFDGAPEKR